MMNTNVKAIVWYQGLNSAGTLPSNQNGNTGLHVLDRFVQKGLRRLHDGIKRIADTNVHRSFDHEIMIQLALPSLIARLNAIATRTLALESSVAQLEGRLSGETAAERFDYFVRQLQQPQTRRSFFLEYPVLARLISIHIDQWVQCNLEFLARIQADWDLLHEQFSPDSNLGELEQIQRDAGNSHRGGRSVWIIRFTSGVRLVYKPRPMAIDVHFQELLEWLNARGSHPPLRPIRVLDRGDYGWSEFVEHTPCTSRDEIRQFYKRQGGYLAILYFLQATDFHFENIIACGPDPVLVDLETLMHSQLSSQENSPINAATVQAFNGSVVRVGFLPLHIWTASDSQEMDLSGLGVGESGDHLDRNVRPNGGDTGHDQKRLHQPQLPGTRINVAAFTKEILEGFTNMYRTFVNHREDLDRIDGPLRRFAGDQIRIVMRPTRTYSALLRESYHPDLLRNALDRDRHFDLLWKAIEREPFLAEVIPSEQDDLWRGDIPIFNTRTDSRDLWCSDGRRIEKFLAKSGMELVTERLRDLDEEDLQRQLWFVQSSFATLDSGSEPLAMKTRSPSGETGRASFSPIAEATTEQLLEASRAIANRLDTLGLCRSTSEGVTWIGLANERRPRLTPMGPDLYGGVAGVALFAAYLGKVSGNSRYTEMAALAVKTLRRQIESSEPSLTSIGGFDGWGGVVYTLTHLGVLWQDTRLLAEAESLVEMIRERINKDQSFDIIGGAAGCIPPLLALYNCTASPSAIAAARECGDWLVANAQKVEGGLGWIAKGNKNVLTGFSHGAAGIAWALSKLSRATGECRFRVAARAAISYERCQFSPQAGNWPDLREIGPEKANEKRRFMCAWCHGAPGIGLSRIGMLREVNDTTLPQTEKACLRSEIDVAIQTTLANGFGGNHSLCHGELGNIDILLQASQLYRGDQEAALKIRVGQIASRIMQHVKKSGWKCGVPVAIEVPGLMTGLAGIGYGLLRIAAPEWVPSVLTLDAPPDDNWSSERWNVIRGAIHRSQFGP